MRRWESWEEETRTLQYEIANDPRRFRLTRQTSFGRRHLKLWSHHPLLIWPVCFVRQFSASVTKTDYFTLRNGFIVAHFSEGSNFDFRKFLNRTFDDDFVQVVGISFWIWIFSIFFIFFSAHGFYSYFWLPFIPLLMVLAVGTKLQVIITKMCMESRNKTAVIKGTMLVQPSDNLFWFNRPQWLLYLIHFILFQNSFQLAFFTWTWYEFGLRSCFHRTTVDISLRIAMGVTVQFLCGYVTLPLYALVTQMGSGMKEAVFTERIVTGLKHWHSLSHQKLSRNGSSLTRHSSETFTEPTAKGLKHWHSLGHLNLSRIKSDSGGDSSEPWWHNHKREDPLSNVKEFVPAENEGIPPLSIQNSITSEITEEEHRTDKRGTYDSDVSFRKSVENDQVRPLTFTNSTTREITEEKEEEEHEIVEKETYNGEISFGTFVEDDIREITEEVVHRKVVDGGIHDGEISFRTLAEQDQHSFLSITNSSTSETTEDVLQHKVITGETHDGEISFRASAMYDQPTISTITKTTQGLLQQERITRGTYDGEISFGTSWKELETEREMEDVNKIMD